MKAEQLFNIRGKVALVTGSTGGLGAVFAKGLAENGATVILNGRNAEKVNKQLADFRELGYVAYPCVFDVINSSEINKAIDEVAEKVGKIDILVNNAGINLRAPLEYFDDDDW